MILLIYILYFRGNTPDTKGTAFVVYEDIFDAKNACDHLSGFNVCNRYLVVLYYQSNKVSLGLFSYISLNNSLCRQNQYKFILNTIRSTELLARLGIEDLDLILKERRLCWYGHVECSNGAVKTAFDVQVD